MEKEWVFTFTDVVRFFREKKSFYLKLFLCSFVFALFTGVAIGPTYRSTALFESAPKNPVQKELMRSLLQDAISPTSQSNAEFIFKSRTLLEQVAMKLGLQIHEESLSLFEKIIGSVKGEFGRPFYRENRWEFRDVLFSGETNIAFSIELLEDREHFLLYFKNKDPILGKIGTHIHTDLLDFIVRPKGATPLKRYQVLVSPMRKILKEMKKKITVKTQKINKNLLVLSCEWNSRLVPSEILNTMMNLYQQYLVSDHEKMAEVQMQYLEKREKELMAHYQKSLEEHANYLIQSIDQHGFITLKQEVDSLEVPNERYISRMHEVDLELKRFKHVEEKTPSLTKIYALKQQESRACSFEQARWNGFKPLVNHAAEFEGMSFENIQKLYMEYVQQFDSVQGLIRELLHIEKKLPEKNFELSGLSGILTDRISLEMIEHGAKLSSELQDIANHTIKDRQRLEMLLLSQKESLLVHVKQMLSMQQLKESLLRDKIYTLQKMISAQLRNEKKLIEEQLVQMRSKMKSFPEKWKREHELLLKKDLGMSMIEGLAQVAESKNIHHNLFHVESKPIDIAKEPYLPEKKYISEISFFFGTMVFLFWFMKDFIGWLSKGTRMTQKLLTKLKINWLEERSKREMCRKIASFIATTSGKVVLWSQSSSHSLEVASILVDRKIRVLYIECIPSKSYQGVGGLRDYLEGQNPFTINCSKGVDSISFGVYTPIYRELLARKKMNDLLENLEYDKIILNVESSIQDSVTQILKLYSNLCIIEINEHQMLEEIQEVECLPLLCVFSRCT